MSKTMLVNVTHVEESRVAIVEEAVLSAYEIETINRTSMKGNIYNAVVESIHASLEAAFVRIGPDMKGFLPLDEVNFKLLPTRSDTRKGGKIGQHLQAGQKLMVQVVREPFSGKPPTVSTYFSLPGRFLVLMPGVDSAGISRKIEDAAQRDRLKKLVGELRAPEGFGVIVRTAGMGQTKVELQRDLRYLLRLWESIQSSSRETEFPGLVYREADLVIRTIRDHFTPDIGEVWIDSEETYEKALNFMRGVMPTKAKTLKLYTGQRPLFNKFNLEEQIERIYKRRVPLPSGGEIVIDGTEALTAIDVNSARSKRQADLEEVTLQTNLEAAGEIARQLRLRDLGGLIVVDFIDMYTARNKLRLEKTMRDAMRGDKARSDVTKLSKLGLMEIARQRIKGEKLAASYSTCPVCDGHGLIRTVETAGLAAFRKLQTRSAKSEVGRVHLVLPREVAIWMLNNKRDELRQIERRHGVRVEIEPSDSLLRHESKFETAPRQAGDPMPIPEGQPERPAPRPEAAPPAEKEPEKNETAAGDRVVPFPAPEGDTDAKPATDGEAEPSDGRPKRRRRRRRRGARVTGDGADDENRGTESADPPAETQVAVPRGVRSDELMPAAVGGKRKTKAAGATRRRRGGPRSGPARRGKPGGRRGGDA
jgi:ribonuclease E